MQNFLFKHVGHTSFQPNFQGALPASGIMASMPYAGPNYIEATPTVSVGGTGGEPLVFLAKCGTFVRTSQARGSRHAITSKGCFFSEGQQMIAYAFRCQLPTGTDPRSIDYATFRSMATNVMISPIVGNNGLGTISWEDTSSLDVIPGGESVEVFYGVVLRAFGTAASSVVGAISGREVIREYSIFQPLK